MKPLFKTAGHSKKQIQKEVVLYKQLLEEYSITFRDVVKSCPKKENERQDAINLARLIAENDFFLTLLKKKKKLPIRELNEFVSGYHRTVRKYKMYILAMSLLYVGKFTYLQGYLNDV